MIENKKSILASKRFLAIDWVPVLPLYKDLANMRLYI